MIEGSKYCGNVLKNHFNKELLMTKEDDEDFENSTNCWIYDNTYVDGDEIHELEPKKMGIWLQRVGEA